MRLLKAIRNECSVVLFNHILTMIQSIIVNLLGVKVVSAQVQTLQHFWATDRNQICNNMNSGTSDQAV